jgi:membrane protein implicated in regulation of membrane protease activity
MLIAGLAGLFLLPAPWNVVAVCAAALVEVGEVAFWLRFLRRYRVRTGAEGMIGERGEVIEAVSAEGGRVRVYGEIWAARSSIAVSAGQPVRIAGVDVLTLEVEPDPATEKGP